MTPPAANAAGRPRPAPSDRRAAAARPARRVSGPLRAPTPRPAGPGVGGRPIAVPRPARRSLPAGERLLEALRALPDHRLLDRLVRGRAWIAILAAALLGIVFLQVSLLKLNAGIGRAVQHSALLQRQNADLRDSVSRLSSGDRVQRLAAQMGLQVPTPGTVRFVEPSAASAALAAVRIRPPLNSALSATSSTRARVPSSATAATSASPTSGYPAPTVSTTATGTPTAAAPGTASAPGASAAGASTGTTAHP